MVDFFINDFTKVWIAPIITAIVSGIFIYTFTKQRETKKQISNIEAAEEKLISIITPFYINGCNLSKSAIESIRQEVLRKFGLDHTQLIDYFALKNAIIYIISESRFINECIKVNLISQVENDFSDFDINNESDIAFKNKKELFKSSHRLRYAISLCFVYFAFIFMYSSIFPVDIESIALGNLFSENTANFISVLILSYTATMLIYLTFLSFYRKIHKK